MITRIKSVSISRKNKKYNLEYYHDIKENINLIISLTGFVKVFNEEGCQLEESLDTINSIVIETSKGVFELKVSKL